MNSVINHVANVAIAAQPKVSADIRTHATAYIATTVNAKGCVVKSSTRVSACRMA